MIDTHSHIYVADFDQDRDEAILRAKEAGVERMYLPNVNTETVGPMLSVCEAYPDYCLPMMGLHPEDVGADWQSDLDTIEQLIDDRYVGIGEVGLDFHEDPTYKQQQFDAFARQIEWALGRDLPIIIHSRMAHRDLVDVMRSYQGRGPRGIFHCFGGPIDKAHDLLSFDGFALGIGGVVTYKRSGLAETVRELPLERIVLETDCPWLAPVPHRGRRNESAYLKYVLQRIAEETGQSEAEVDKITTLSALNFFAKAQAKDK